VAVIFAVLAVRAARARYDLRYLPPAAFRALMALAEVLVLEGEPEIAPAEVAGRVDHYLAGFAARGKWKIRLALWALAYYPLATGRPPFHLMPPEARLRFVRRRFVDDVAYRLVPEWLRRLRQSLIRAAQQMCFLGYYGDPRAAEQVGYTPYSRRPRAIPIPPRDDPRRLPLRCLTPADVAGEELTADVVIVGTGAGGATLARELARRHREVLLLERGPHVDPTDFSEDEAAQLSALYADGALTLSRDFRFQVLQGSCVGGSTTVNNAVCLRIPPAVLAEWTDPERLDTGLDPVRLGAAFDEVERFLRVETQPDDGQLNPGARYVERGVRALGLDRPPWRWERVAANINECVGCGYCNIGCAYARKLSALDWTLPHAQREFGADNVRILAECEVEKVLMRGWRAAGVQARLSDGRRVTVRADTVVLSAGAVASSLVLQRSGLGDGQAGRRLAFNMATPVTLDFDAVLHSEQGLQISHVLSKDPVTSGSTVLETWFNPPTSQSLFMPGWFEEHRANMLRYQHMTSVGVVVGTKANATVRGPGLVSGPVEYTPDPDDVRKVKAGIRLTASIGFEAEARRVLPATFRPLALNSDVELPRIDREITDGSDVSLNTAHPQGGNTMCRDARRGVVDPDFRVYGTENVHVVDASVFPSAITVNPQLTVMALAAYAADAIGGPAPPPQAPSATAQAAAPGPGS
jgi:choline dehydrogenase-like flavoprotein